jgi:hypothetical protein
MLTARCGSVSPLVPLRCLNNVYPWQPSTLCQYITVGRWRKENEHGAFRIRWTRRLDDDLAVTVETTCQPAPRGSSRWRSPHLKHGRAGGRRALRLRWRRAPLRRSRPASAIPWPPHAAVTWSTAARSSSRAVWDVSCRTRLLVPVGGQRFSRTTSWWGRDRRCRHCRGGCGLAGEEASDITDRAHQRGREHHRGVVVHPQLDQSLQIAQLQG